MTSDHAERFSDRVLTYDRGRPTYPPEVVRILEGELGFEPGWSVCDVGSGTGLLTRLFLAEGYAVRAVEPNDSMRTAAEAKLAGSTGFVSVAGKAEDTGLPTDSVDLVTAAQSAHWFDLPAARSEFRRILRAPGWVALVWNQRRATSTSLAGEYEALMKRFGTDYLEVRAGWDPEQALEVLFGANGHQTVVLENPHPLDREGLRARATSSSYTPGPGHPEHRPMMEALDRLFDTYGREGQIVMEYDTSLYWGEVLF